MRSTKRKAKMTIPLAMVAGFLPAVADIKNNANSFGGWGASALHTGAGLIGYDTVNKKYVGWSQAKAAGLPGVALGFLVHILATKLGINRSLSRAGIPFIRI
jgi:hypothetical protein